MDSKREEHTDEQHIKLAKDKLAKDKLATQAAAIAYIYQDDENIRRLTPEGCDRNSKDYFIDSASTKTVQEIIQYFDQNRDSIGSEAKNDERKKRWEQVVIDTARENLTADNVRNAEGNGSVSRVFNEGGLDSILFPYEIRSDIKNFFQRIEDGTIDDDSFDLMRAFYDLILQISRRLDEIYLGLEGLEDPDGLSYKIIEALKEREGCEGELSDSFKDLLAAIQKKETTDDIDTSMDRLAREIYSAWLQPLGESLFENKLLNNLHNELSVYVTTKSAGQQTAFSNFQEFFERAPLLTLMGVPKEDIIPWVPFFSENFRDQIKSNAIVEREYALLDYIQSYEDFLELISTGSVQNAYEIVKNLYSQKAKIPARIFKGGNENQLLADLVQHFREHKQYDAIEALFSMLQGDEITVSSARDDNFEVYEEKGRESDEEKKLESKSDLEKTLLDRDDTNLNSNFFRGESLLIGSQEGLHPNIYIPALLLLLQSHESEDRAAIKAIEAVLVCEALPVNDRLTIAKQLTHDRMERWYIRFFKSSELISVYEKFNAEENGVDALVSNLMTDKTSQPSKGDRQKKVNVSTEDFPSDFYKIFRVDQEGQLNVDEAALLKCVHQSADNFHAEEGDHEIDDSTTAFGPKVEDLENFLNQFSGEQVRYAKAFVQTCVQLMTDGRMGEDEIASTRERMRKQACQGMKSLSSKSDCIDLIANELKFIEGIGSETLVAQDEETDLGRALNALKEHIEERSFYADKTFKPHYFSHTEKLFLMVLDNNNLSADEKFDALKNIAEGRAERPYFGKGFGMFDRQLDSSKELHEKLRDANQQDFIARFSEQPQQDTQTQNQN
ncbi:MAG: hypothetical protein ACE365_01325 [Gammaproteobacteria bacterium]